MKKRLTIISLPALLIGMLLCSNTGFAQKRITGNGNIQSQSRQVSNFKKINCSCIFHVFLTQGNATSVKVEADENLFPYIITEVHGNTLDLKIKKRVNIKPTKSIKVYLTIKNLEEMMISGVCKVQGQNALNIDHLNIEVSGSGDLNLNLKATALRTAVSGTGKVELQGSSKNAEYRISGSAEVKAGDLVTDNTHIAISGIGKMHVNAQEKLDVAISGTGKIWYKGSPEISESVSGMGKIEKE